ncbi:MAG: bifunctional homocysteine S-methyltransferase/methylenetetrahydrofolate reductase [Acidobacteriota bacterium]
MSKREALASWMKESVILADGAMGTVLHLRGIPRNRCLEEANLSQADLVFALHREYVHAGAQILTTNTFKANRLGLRVFDLEGRLEEINARGVEIARRAAHGAPVWVGASIGPLKVMLKPYGDMEEEAAREICREQVAALASAEPDLFILETQQSALETCFFIDACREVAPEIPILASLTFNREGRTFFGDTPVEGCRRLAKQGADVVGINCSVGPADTLPLVEEVCQNVGHPLVVMPNAGYPTEVDGQIHYLSSPEYVANYIKRYVDLGVNIVGGCCGTTPETIRAVAQIIRKRPPVKRQGSQEGWVLVEDAPAAAPPPQGGGFFARLRSGFAVTCEINPPKGPDAREAVEMARLLKQAGSSAVDIADNPMARVRVSSMALAHFVQQETGLPTILHMTCRDRNLLALQSELLGASLLGVEGILALSGDPTAHGDFPAATSVNDVNVVGLVKIIASLNRGLDFSDHPTGTPTQFAVGVGVNLMAPDPEKEIAKLRERLDAGAVFAMSQPVFDLEPVRRFLDRMKDLPVVILPGVLPIASLKQALYLANEVPGMTVPGTVMDRFERLERREDQMALGVELAQELLRGLKEFAAGAYLTSGGRKMPVLVDVLAALH